MTQADGLVPEVEHESAWVLNDIDAARIALSDLVTGPRATLHNVYFDDGDTLLRMGATLRVRYALGPVGRRMVPGKATLKLTRGFDGAIRRADEYTGSVHVDCPPDAPTWSDPFWPLELRTHLLQAGARRPRRLGTLPVVRSRCEVPGLGSFDLDAMLLPDGTVLHEAEIEQADRGQHERLVAWLMERAPAASRSTMNKHERFRQALRV